MIKSFLKLALWIILIVAVANTSAYIFNYVSPWLGLFCATLTVIGVAALFLYYFGKLASSLDREEEKLN